MAQSLSQWLAYIESLHPKNIELGLERVKAVATSLKISPSKDVKIFTIAGTNGKGSTAAFLESILQTAGYTTAVYTSPHLLRFNERIRMNGQGVSDHALIQAFEAVEHARGEIQLTYFEFTTLAAFWLFQKANLNVWVLEVGLGGRLDAVNIIDPDVAIITTIELDHMDWLGDDREKIGREKAGIMRQGVPVVCGDTHPPDSIFETAQTVGAELYCLGQDFAYQKNPDGGWSWSSAVATFADYFSPSSSLRAVIEDHGTKQSRKNASHPRAPRVSWSTEGIAYTSLPLPHLPLQNAATALMALHVSGLEVDEEAIARGLSQATLMGRFQVIEGAANVILDVAHNPHAAQYLADRLSSIPYDGETRAVIGILKDKDIPGILRPLLPHIDNWYIGTLELPRGETAENIANYLHNLGVSAYDTQASVRNAFLAAMNGFKGNVVVFGSFYTVAEVMSFLGG